MDKRISTKSGGVQLLEFFYYEVILEFPVAEKKLSFNEQITIHRTDSDLFWIIGAQ